MGEQTTTRDVMPSNMEFNVVDLDVGPLVQFSEPIEDVYVQPDASIPVTPPRSGSRGDSDIDRTSYEVTQRSPPLRRDLLNHYNLNSSRITP
jgi:hypothetical protein